MKEINSLIGKIFPIDRRPPAAARGNGSIGLIPVEAARQAPELQPLKLLERACRGSHDVPRILVTKFGIFD